MSVKTKDRHISKRHSLYKARELMGYILVLTRPREFDKDGKQICKPGLLGEGQPLQAFGLDIIKCGKGIHACCYEASKINLLWLQGKIKTEEIQQSYQGWRAHIGKGTCFYIIQDMDNYFSSLFKGVEIK